MSPRASFLVVQVRLDTWRWPLVLPVPLFVLEDVLESCALLARLLAWMGVRVGWRGTRRLARLVPESLLVEGLKLPAAAVRCLRDQGRFTLAEVRDGRALVAVRLL